jgi:hypothetical protein
MRYSLDVRDKPGLLAAIMQAFAGDAQISFEGDLSRCRLRAIPGASDAETPVLCRNTVSPRQDFVVLPLETETARPILDAVVPEGGIVNRVFMQAAGTAVSCSGLRQPIRVRSFRTMSAVFSTTCAPGLRLQRCGRRAERRGHSAGVSGIPPCDGSVAPKNRCKSWSTAQRVCSAALHGVRCCASRGTR